MIIQLEQYYMTGDNKIKNIGGYTLMELIISITIFSVTIILVTQIFKFAMQSQMDAIAGQNIQESMRFTYESMAKEIRTARKSNDIGVYECQTFAGAPNPNFKVYNIFTKNSNDALYFKNKDGFCVLYYIDNNYLMIKRQTSAIPSDDKLASTTPSAIKISNLKFNIIDDAIGVFHTLQPLVTIKMDAEVIGDNKFKNQMKLQTSVSSRYYE